MFTLSQNSKEIQHLPSLCLLDPDFEAEAVAGLALRRLAGAGTVQLGTLQENTSLGKLLK